MDSLSVTAGILTIVVAYQDVLSKAKALISTAQPELFAELEIYGEILSEISNIALQSTELPKSAQMCMRLCQDRIDQVCKQISEGKEKPIKRNWRNHDGLKAELESMRSSIVLLRDIVMDSITHTLLRQTRVDRAKRADFVGDAFLDLELGPEEVEKGDLEETFRKYTAPFMEGKRVGDVHVKLRTTGASEDKVTSAREKDIERLRQQLLSTEARSAQNPWTKAVHVLHTDPERGHEIVMAKIDTQSPPNWVSVEIVQRLGMEDAIKTYDGPRYQGAGGEEIGICGVVTLQWYDSQIAKSRWNEFLVTANPAPFDLILGWEWLKEEGHWAFEEPVLAIREMRLTPEQHREMQAGMLERGKQDEALIAARRAQEAANHDLKRLMKAQRASRTSSIMPSRMVSHAQSVMLTRRQSFENAASQHTFLPDAEAGAHDVVTTIDTDSVATASTTECTTQAQAGQVQAVPSLPSLRPSGNTQ